MALPRRTFPLLAKEVAELARGRQLPQALAELARGPQLPQVLAELAGGLNPLSSDRCLRHLSKQPHAPR
jgi:hypothetical protein